MKNANSFSAHTLIHHMLCYLMSSRERKGQCVGKWGFGERDVTWALCLLLGCTLFLHLLKLPSVCMSELYVIVLVRGQCAV